MGILDAVLAGQNGQLIGQIAQSIGLSEVDAKNVINQLLPAVSKGIKSNIGSSEGLGGLMNALSSGDHQRYLDNPGALSESSAVDDGNAILGHIFGGKDVSRNVAGNAAEATGVDSSLIKKVLPLLATTVMGALSKETVGSGFNVGNLLDGDTSSVGNLVSSFLDADNDGDVTDDLFNIAKKFF